MTEDQVLNKYETEFSQYCFDVLDVTHNDAYLKLMENGRFWDWLKEYHNDEWRKLEMGDFEKDVYYCVYCYAEQNDRLSCCHENHFLSGKDLMDRELELDEIDRQMVKASGKVYDPPMSETEQYLLNKEREEEHKSYDY